MSGQGAPTDQPVPNGAGLRVAIVASSWHEEVMTGLIGGAVALCAQARVSMDVIKVPGSFELPVVAAQCAKTHDAVIALGVIIRGGTPHFEFVAGAATDGLTRVALDSGKPIGFGLLTCDNETQALDRAGLAGSTQDKGREAAAAAISTALLLRGARAGAV